jgi:hypothetical protein
MIEEEEGGYIKKKASTDTPMRTKSEYIDTVFCTIRMITEAKKDEKDEFEYESIKMKTVVIIGRAYNFTLESLRNTMIVNDNTGSIVAMAYKAQPDQDANQEILSGYKHEDGAYVRIYGKIVSIKDKQGVVIDNIRSINGNEITNHYLKVVSGYLYKKHPDYIGISDKPSTKQATPMPTDVDPNIAQAVIGFGKAKANGFSFEELFEELEKKNDSWGYELLHASVESMMSSGILKMSANDGFPTYTLKD